MNGGLHAARQLVWHLRARPVRAPAWLTPAEARLFEQMPPADQFEGLAVADTLRGWGYGGDRILLAGAALHDLGKSLAPPGAVWRVLATAMEALPPGLRRLAARRGPLAALARHAEVGAALAEEASLSVDVVWLIREHHSAIAGERMSALQRADALH